MPCGGLAVTAIGTILFADTVWILQRRYWRFGIDPSEECPFDFALPEGCQAIHKTNAR
jgi:hypothetical protein